MQALLLPQKLVAVSQVWFVGVKTGRTGIYMYVDAGKCIGPEHLCSFCDHA